MPHSPSRTPDRGSRSPLRGGFRQPALRNGSPRRVSRIPTLQGSLAGPSNRFRQSFQSDYGWNSTFNSREEARRAQDPNELAFNAFEGFNPQKHPYKFFRAPWWHHRLVGDHEECARFAVDHMLPGDLPLSAIQKREWRMYAALPTEALRYRFNRHRTHAQNLELIRDEHIRATAKAFELTKESQIIPSNLPIDSVYYRNHGDREYIARLMAWSRDNNALGVTHSDRSEPGSVVDTDVMVGTLLPANFRFVCRKDASSTSINGFRENALDQAKYERRVRKKYGYLIPHERKEIWRIKQERQSHLYVAPPPEWVNLELPAGFHVPLPGVLAYKTTDLARTYGAPFWVVLYADWAAHVAAYWMWEIYSSCRLWHLPKLVYLLIRELWDGLVIPLGGEDNRNELRDWLELLQRIDWNDPEDVPYKWNCRSQQQDRSDPCMDDRFLGRTHNTCGDFVYVHPWRRIRLTRDEKEYYQRYDKPAQPRNHPKGYIIMDRNKAPTSSDAPMGPPPSRRSPRRSNSSRDRVPNDPAVLNIRFRRDPAGTVNIDPVPEDVRELIMREFSHDLGLFQRHEHPDQWAICDRLVQIVFAPRERMKSAFYRTCISNFLSDAGISHPCLSETTDPKVLMQGIIDQRVQRAQAQVARTDVDMTDANPNTAVNGINAEDQAVTTGTEAVNEIAPSTGEVPKPTGSEPEARGDTLPPNGGLKRKTTGDKEPVQPPAKRITSDPDGSQDSGSPVPVSKNKQTQVTRAETENVTKPDGASDGGTAGPKPVGSQADATADGTDAQKSGGDAST